jgi:hypothetical protein
MLTSGSSGFGMIKSIGPFYLTSNQQNRLNKQQHSHLGQSCY